MKNIKLINNIIYYTGFSKGPSNTYNFAEENFVQAD
jgi:hypothetical protein